MRLKLIALVVLILAGFLLFQKIKPSNNTVLEKEVNYPTTNSQTIEELSTATTETQTTTDSVEIVEYQDYPSLEIESLDKTLKAELYYPKNVDIYDTENKCRLVIKDLKGNEIKYSSTLLPKGNFVSCYEVMEIITSDVKGWAGDNKLIVLSNPGLLSILEPLANRATEYTFEGKSLEFIYVSKDLNRWLFKRTDIVNKEVFQIFDSKHNLVKDNITFPKQLNDRYSTQYYDSLNNVFLFVYNEKDEEATVKAQRAGEPVGEDYYYGIVKFDVVNGQNLNIYNLFSSNPILYSGGRGCNREELTSESKVLIIHSSSGGCISVDKNYYNSQGELRMILK